MTKTGEARAGRPRFGSKAIALLTTIGLLPSLVLAVYSLTQPWAHGRVVGVWGVSRSASAQVLVIGSVLAILVVSIGVIARGRRLLSVAALHLFLGFAMIAVSILALDKIKHAGVSALGLLPIASARSGPGVKVFFLAAFLIVLLGAFELAVGAHQAPENHVIRRVASRRRKSRRNPPVDSPTCVVP
jgi:hypothetical protein